MIDGKCTTQPYRTLPPLYQTSPALPAPSLPNMNIMPFPPLAEGAKIVMETNKAYLSHVILDPPIVFQMFLELGQYRHGAAKFSGDALTPFIYPVFNKFSPERRLVGLCLATIYWRLHFENTLPNNANGIIAVLSNTQAGQNHTFTDKINGPNVEFLGRGDLHHPNFDSYEMSADISHHLNSLASIETEGYTAVPLTEEGAQYSLRIYPSSEINER